MPRILLSVCLVLVIAAGAFTMFQTSDADAAVHIQKKCMEQCPSSIYNGSCWVVGCNKDECHYRCYPSGEVTVYIR